MTPPAAPRGRPDNRTALPWEAKPALDSAYEWDIVNAAGWKVAEIIALGPPDPLPTESNAKFIARAVNSFGPLVEALEKIAEQFCDSDECFASADARAALARGEGAR